MAGVEAQLSALASLSSAALRDEWRRLTASPVPRVSPSLLRLALAWEIQARAGGGHSRSTTVALDQLGRGQTTTRVAAAGMRLVREWQGKVHVVVVGEDQVIRW